MLYDICATVLAVLLSFLMTRTFIVKQFEYNAYIECTAFILVVYLVCSVFFRVYRSHWRYTSVADAMKVLKAVCLTAVCSYFVVIQYLPRDIARIIVIDLLFFQASLVLGARVLYRLSRRTLSGTLNRDGVKRAVIVGAGGAGELIARDLLANYKDKVRPCLFVDDDPDKKNREIHGIRVAGEVDDLPDLVERFSIDTVIIAITLATSDKINQVFNYVQQLGLSCKILPNLQDIASDNISSASLREVKIEDLLCRDPINIVGDKPHPELHDRVVLVTGGGGSIGSELCRQIVKQNPSKLIILEHSEYNLYAIEKKLTNSFPAACVEAMLVNVADMEAVSNVFKQNKVDIVFHAAAYKHVPLLQKQIIAAVKNNVLGTKVVSDCANRFGVNKFVLVSTDKAVDPCNVMGMTKCLAEIICKSAAKVSQTRYLTVRFGNVLGSVGSVVPLFKEQIKAGGPITVTDPDATRFFMTIPEAAQLILQAAYIGQENELFVLDMGEPVKIVFLAEQLMKLMGVSSKDISIEFTGLRPGERVHEKLFYDVETLKRTDSSKIYIASSEYQIWPDFSDDLSALLKASHDLDEARTVASIKKVITKSMAQKHSYIEEPIA